jgi:uncharacterized protein (DUF58 family)
MLVLDLSASTLFGSGGRDGRTTKRLQIARLAGALAFAAIRTGDRVGMITFTDRIDSYLPPRRSRGHVWAVVRAAFEHTGRAHRRTGSALRLRGRGRAREAAQRRVRRQRLPERDPVRIASSPSSRGATTRTASSSTIRSSAACRLSGSSRSRMRRPAGARVIDTSAIDPQRSVEARIQQLRRLGVRARSIGTDEDPFALLIAHFRTLERMR